MTEHRPRKVFVNLPVSDLARSKAFFDKLGFHYDARFTNEKAACMILSEQGFVMLLQRDFFATFTRRAVADTDAPTETLVAISCESREEVTELLRIALENGGRAAMPPQDYGFMFQSSFYDPDGHHWELGWMDPSHLVPKS
jgi:predicted lactoylglutathione lyase